MEDGDATEESDVAMDDDVEADGSEIEADSEEDDDISHEDKAKEEKDDEDVSKDEKGDDRSSDPKNSQSEEGEDSDDENNEPSSTPPPISKSWTTLAAHVPCYTGGPGCFSHAPDSAAADEIDVRPPTPLRGVSSSLKGGETSPSSRLPRAGRCARYEKEHRRRGSIRNRRPPVAETTRKATRRTRRPRTSKPSWPSPCLPTTVTSSASRGVIR